MKRPKAIIFDLDGVITDTAENHYLAWKKLADELGIKMDRQFNEQLKGVERIESLEKILALDPTLQKKTADEKQRLANQKNEHYKQLISSTSPKNILPGVEKLLKEIKQKGIKIALGSASKNASMIVDQLELTSYFDYIVDAAKVTNGKPNPETFTTAADHLGVQYNDCIGIEDAIAGVEAINSAQMFSVGVGSIDHLYAADYVVENTSELQLKTIIDLYNDWKMNIKYRRKAK